MVMPQKAIRAFEGVAGLDIFRVVGRRPSSVWVDAAGKVSRPAPENQQLKELVFWRTKTRPGEQIQERVGGLFLVTPDGGCHPIILCLPQPLQPETAFVHAQKVRNDDMARVEELLASGEMVRVVGYKVKNQPSRPGERLLPADHPLIVDERPLELDESAGAQMRASRRF